MAYRKKIVEGIVNPILRILGGEVVPNWKATSLDSAMRRVIQRNREIKTVVDVGASYGKWSITAQKYFPNADFLLIEAQRIHEQRLQAFKSKCPNIDYVLAAAGDTEGEVYFNANDPFGGQASHEELLGEHVMRIPVTTIDLEIKKRGFNGPFLVKLDTHGFEVPILTGAQETMRNTSLIVIETYNFRVAKGALRFHEMCSWLETQGFRTIDMCDPLYRLKDGVLWQFDLFFAPINRPEFQMNSFT